MSKDQHNNRMPKVIYAEHSNDTYSSIDIGGTDGKQIGFVKLGDSNGRIFFVPTVEVKEGDKAVIPELDVEFGDSRIVLYPGSALEVCGVYTDINELTTIGSVEELESFLFGG